MKDTRIVVQYNGKEANFVAPTIPNIGDKIVIPIVNKLVEVVDRTFACSKIKSGTFVTKVIYLCCQEPID